MLQIKDLCLNFKQQTIFDEISFTLDQEDRVGLVGLNGSGKSTLLKVISGQQEPDSGFVTILGDKKLAYMPQEVVLLSEKTVLDETLTAFSHLHKLQQEVNTLEERVESGKATHQQMSRYADAQQELVLLNPNRLLGETQKMLLGLGFSQEQLTKSVSDLSVGWKMRVVLAKLLLQDADFYLFDEPTNHLDIVAKDWFLNFLKGAQFGFLLVCHERFFLDQVCDKIFELERGKGVFYKGGYSAYEKQKERDLAQLESAYNAQQKEIKHKMDLIERFKASASRAKQAQSMLKAVNKIERIEIPPSAKKINFKFPPLEQSGRTVLTVKNLSQQFGAKKIFENVSLEVERGQKVAIVAANGVGKTTLLNTIIGSLPQHSGTIEFGHNVKTAIFDQDQNKSLNLHKSIIENVEESCTGTTQVAIRSFLGSFLFSNDDVHKKVGVLSGGEKNRVGMICVLLQGANLFLLDEPTNHLDIPSKETLLRALKQFEGTILFVSHDHDFVNRLATRVIELTPHGVNSYDGNYDSYLYQKKATAGGVSDESIESRSQKTDKTAKAESKKQRLLEKESKKLEAKIAKLEQQIEKTKHEFEGLSWSDFNFVVVEDKLKALQKERAQLMGEWEKLVERLSS